MGERYVGLMSGTSQDGVDAVLVTLDSGSFEIHRSATTPYPDSLRRRIGRLLATPEISLPELGRLDVAIGDFFARCVTRLLKDARLEPHKVRAIGHSGHTVYHDPSGPEPFTTQLGDPSTVAARTGITTVGHLRQMDVALGGQGAPLAPAFHQWAFSDAKECRIVVNIGGIANLTVLEPGRKVRGYDTGPGNTLLDGWTKRCTGEPYDRNGEWSRSGQVRPGLLEIFMSEPYFSRVPPKSTGLEHFNQDWLRAHLDRAGERPGDADIQATLTELTAATVAGAVNAENCGPARIILCGGGAHNVALTERLAARLADIPVESSAARGIEPEWVEAVLFAWLARARLRGDPGNIPSVTGAKRAAPMGGMYCGTGRRSHPPEGDAAVTAHTAMSRDLSEPS